MWSLFLEHSIVSTKTMEKNWDPVQDTASKMSRVDPIWVLIEPFWFCIVRVTSITHSWQSNFLKRKTKKKNFSSTLTPLNHAQAVHHHLRSLYILCSCELLLQLLCGTTVFFKSPLKNKRLAHVCRFSPSVLNLLRFAAFTCNMRAVKAALDLCAWKIFLRWNFSEFLPPSFLLSSNLVLQDGCSDETLVCRTHSAEESAVYKFQCWVQSWPIALNSLWHSSYSDTSNGYLDGNAEEGQVDAKAD